ncbi:MAG: lipoteichoic acid synthase [Parasphingorhabdus sp.]|jgi:lipoteichoic acid synthase
MKKPSPFLLNIQFLIATCLPLLLLTVGMKIQRGLEIGSITTVLSAITYVLVELNLFIGLVVVFYFLNLACRSLTLQRSLLTVFYLLTLLILLIEVVGHEVFKQTGLTLIWGLLIFGLQRSDALIQMLSQQLDNATLIGIMVMLAYLFLVPTRIARRFPRSLKRTKNHLWKLMAVSLILTFSLLLTFSAVFGFSREEFRGVTSHLILSYLDHLKASQSTPLPQESTLSKQVLLGRSSGSSNYPNIAVIILESTRQQSVAPYNDLGVTPYFAELAENSLLARNAYSTSPHTSRAIYSILCGQFPRAGDSIVETLPGGVQQPCLPDLLKQQGYATAFFQSATEDFEHRRQLISNMGFSDFFPLEVFDTKGYERANYFGYEDNIMLPTSSQWLKNRQQPFLASYLTVTPHFFYNAISRYGWKNYVKGKRYNAYLNVLFYQDNFLKNLVQQYKDLGLYDNTLFVILGDHGEAFREHKLWGHGNILFEEGVKVPLILHHSDQLKGVVENRVSLMDVLPSVVKYLGFEPDHNIYPGKVLTQPIHQRDIFLECISARLCSALIDADTNLKLIHHYGNKPDLLFDLNVDPLEVNNLFEQAKYIKIKLELLQRLHLKIETIAAPIQVRKYDSWAYISAKQEWLSMLPTQSPGVESISIQPILGDESQIVLRAALSKNELFAGDSAHFSFILPKPSQSVCLVSQYLGIDRHKERSLGIKVTKGGNSRYLKITENLQVSNNNKKVTLKLQIKSSCEANANLLSEQRITIQLAQELSNDAVYNKKSYELYLRQELPPDEATLDSKIYLTELFDLKLPAHEFTRGNAQRLIGSHFVNKLRGKLSDLTKSYGDYDYSKLVGVWKSKGSSNTTVHRYQVFFKKNSSMDFRLHIKDGKLIALYYYRPWKEKFYFR